MTGMVLVVEDEMKLRDLVRSFLERKASPYLQRLLGQKRSSSKPKPCPTSSSSISAYPTSRAKK